MSAAQRKTSTTTQKSSTRTTADTAGDDTEPSTEERAAGEDTGQEVAGSMDTQATATADPDAIGTIGAHSTSPVDEEQPGGPSTPRQQEAAGEGDQPTSGETKTDEGEQPAVPGAALGKTAYEAYHKAAGNDPQPWDDLVADDEAEARAWSSAAHAALTATFERKS
jgi:hypothetical protein